MSLRMFCDPIVCFGSPHYTCAIREANFVDFKTFYFVEINV